MSQHKTNLTRVEWPTVALLAACHLGWVTGAALVAGFGPAVLPQAVGFALMAVMAALHMSLQHEALHGHPTRNAVFNEALVSLPLAPVFPYRRFKQLHLRHHNDERLTDPYDDPESWYVAGHDWNALGPVLRTALTINNTLAGRLILGPWLMTIGFLVSEARLLRRGDQAVGTAWALHGAGVAVLLAIVSLGFAIPLWQYALFTVWPALSIIALRTYCEHRWAVTPDERTVIVERGGLFGLLFLNNNLHLVHHKRPAVAWYRLPALYRAQAAHWRALNGGYVFASYGEIVRTHLFKPRNPVVHPQWHHAVTVARHEEGQRVMPVSPTHAGPGAVQPVPARPQSR